MVKSIVNTVGTKFISALFSFLVILITSNFLGTEGRGEISLLIASITIILLFSNFVGGNTLVYLSPRKPFGELLLVSYLWSLFSSGLSFLVLYLLHTFSTETSIHIAILSLLFSICAIHISLLFGKEKIEIANKISLFQVILHFFILSFVFILTDVKSVHTFIYSLYITYSLAVIGSAYYLRAYFKNTFSLHVFATLKAAFAVGAVAQMANIFQFLNYRLDLYLLNRFDSISNIGIYGTSVSIAEAVLLFGGSFALVQFSKISNTESEQESQLLTIKLTRFSTLLTLLAYLPLLIFPDEFYSFLLGKDFVHVRKVLIALAPGILLLGSSITLSHYFAGIGKYRINALASFVGLLITFILGLLFIPSYGFMAAAWISSISYAASTVVLILAFKHNSNVKIIALIPSLADIKFLQKSISNVRNNGNS